MLVQRQRNVFTDGHRAKQRAALKRHPDFLADFVHIIRGNRRDIFSFEPDLAGTWPFQAHQGAQQRALAGTGTAQNHHGFAAHHVKIDAVEDFALAITDAKIPKRDHRFRLHHCAIDLLHEIFQTYFSLTKKKSAVNTRSTRITKNIETTTARVVDRPPCSAPAPVETPSRHPPPVSVPPNQPP